MRSLRYGRTPNASARAAMILGQSFDMLNLARNVLEHYRSEVFPGGASLPTLDLVERVRQMLVKNRETPIDYLREAVRRAPNYAQAWLELGRLLIEADRSQEAIAALAKVSISASYDDPDRNPETLYVLANGPYVKAWFYIGHAYEKLGNERAALDAYSEALVYQPGSPVASRALADLLFRRGDVIVSARYWGIAMSYRPFVVPLPKVGRNLNAMKKMIEDNLDRLGNRIHTAEGH